MDIKSQQDADYFEALKKDKEKITKFYEEAFKVPEVQELVPELKQEIEVKLTPFELRQARIKYFTN
jgi:hypothetical protein